MLSSSRSLETVAFLPQNSGPSTLCIAKNTMTVVPLFEAMCEKREEKTAAEPSNWVINVKCSTRPNYSVFWLNKLLGESWICRILWRVCLKILPALDVGSWKEHWVLCLLTVLRQSLQSMAASRTQNISWKSNGGRAEVEGHTNFRYFFIIS